MLLPRQVHFLKESHFSEIQMKRIILTDHIIKYPKGLRYLLALT